MLFQMAARQMSNRVFMLVYYHNQEDQEMVRIIYNQENV